MFTVGEFKVAKVKCFVQRKSGGEERQSGRRRALPPVLHPSSLESIFVKSVSMEVRSAESLALSKLP